MLVTLDGPEFKRVTVEKGAVQEVNYAKFSVVAGTISQYWLSKMEPQKVMILTWVLARTLFYKKEAVRIWKDQFINGIERRDGSGMVCEGCGLTRNTVAKHLRQLVEEDFIHAYRSVRNGVESEARLFEINVNKLIEPIEQNGGETMLAKPKVPREPRSKSPILGSTKRREGGTPSGGGHNICINNRLDKSNLSPLRSEVGTRVLAIPKKGRAAPSYATEERVEDVVRAVAHRHEQVRSVRASAAQNKAPWLLSKEEMQAVIDKATYAYYPDEPRMVVTNKEYGFLKKRLKESAPKSFTEFIDWVIRYWHSIAKQNRNAAMRRGLNGTEDKSTPLDMSPSFSQLVYRLPYFLKAYSNFLAERRSDANDEAEAKQRKRLEARAAEAEKQAAELRTRLRDRNAQKPVVATRITRTVARSQPVKRNDIEDALNAEDNFGEWRGPQSTRGSKYAKR